FFSSRRRHTRFSRDWSSDVCSSDLGDMAIGAYGIINRFVMLFAMIVMGLNQGMQPIVGYNYGAGNIGRVKSAFGRTLLLAFCVLALGYIIGKAFPRQIAELFTNDEELIGLASSGLLIVLTFFPLISIQMVVSNLFQSIGKSGPAIFLSLTRQVLFLLPLMIILPNIYGVNGVWFSMRTADLLSFSVALTFLIIQFRKSKKYN